MTPDDPQWFVMFLCSRWGKSKAEIEALPWSEFNEHWQFWKDFRWGMSDDLQAIAITQYMRKSNPKSTVQPWMIKNWTTHKDFTYKLTRLIVKPASAIRSGFFTMLEAIKAMKNARKH